MIELMQKIAIRLMYRLNDVKTKIKKLKIIEIRIELKAFSTS